MKKSINPLLILLVIAAAFVSSYFGARLGSLNKTETAAEENRLLEANQSIVIAGYDVINLDAHKTEQSVHFYNSDKNECFIIMSLSVDGKVIYTSDMIAPNTKIDKITLSEPLKAGVYDAVVSYSCFDLYSQRELNGTEITVKLEVY